MKVNLKELKEYSKHIDAIYYRIRNNISITESESLEIYKFYSYAQGVLNNIKNLNQVITVDLQKLTRKEVITTLEYLSSKKVKKEKIINLLNSNDPESMRLAIELIRKL